MIALTHFVDSQIHLTGWTEILVKLCVCLVVPNAVTALCFCRMGEFGELFAAIGHIVFKKGKPKAIEAAE